MGKSKKKDAKNIIIAGGLNLKNMQTTLTQVTTLAQFSDCYNIPFAVDVNSGVEDSPGYKNISLLTQMKHKIEVFNSLNIN